MAPRRARDRPAEPAPPLPCDIDLDLRTPRAQPRPRRPAHDPRPPDAPAPQRCPAPPEPPRRPPLPAGHLTLPSGACPRSPGRGAHRSLVCSRSAACAGPRGRHAASFVIGPSRRAGELSAHEEAPRRWGRAGPSGRAPRLPRDALPRGRERPSFHSSAPARGLTPQIAPASYCSFPPSAGSLLRPVGSCSRTSSVVPITGRSLHARFDACSRRASRMSGPRRPSAPPRSGATDRRTCCAGEATSRGAQESVRDQSRGRPGSRAPLGRKAVAAGPRGGGRRRSGRSARRLRPVREAG